MAIIQQGAAAGLWQAAVRDAEDRSGTALDEAQESYLVFVLLRHQNDADLLARVQALEWLRAQEHVGRSRTDALRDVGDRCLLITGLYPALAQRRRVSVEYFTQLGRGAYRDVADACRDAYAGLFAQLAAHYDALVSVLRGLRDGPLPMAQPAAAPPSRSRRHLH